MLALVLAACLALLTLVPPLQSPDEHDHVRRAYGLLNGVLLLEAPSGKMSGLAVDTGLESYLQTYYVKYMRDRAGKLTLEEMAQAEAIRWSHVTQFGEAPGTGYYFPLIYAPQALGLALGRAMDLNVDLSYRLARGCALLASVLLAAAAFRLARPPIGVLALLLLPMTLFQWSAASIDGVSTGWALLAIASFLALVDERRQGPRRRGMALPLLLALSLLLLVGSRVHMLPMLLLPFVAWALTRRRDVLVAGLLALVLTLLWLAVALSHTVDTRLTRDVTTAAVAQLYLRDPGEFFANLWNTLIDPRGGEFFFDSFIGVLGWLDVRLPEATVLALGLLLAAAAVLGSSASAVFEAPLVRTSLMACAVASFMLVFAALAITWNSSPTDFIEGVQGRYFIVPALCLAYALAPGPAPIGALPRALAWLCCAALGALSIVTTIDTIARTYLVSESASAPAPAATNERGPLLAAGGTLALAIPPSQVQAPQTITHLAVLFDTQGQALPGQAELRLRADDGSVVQRRFVLADLADQRYRQFDVPPGRYVSVQIASIDGSGLSVRQVSATGPVPGMACLMWGDARQQLTLMPGCPAP